MLATKGIARKAAAGELSIDLDRAERAALDDVRSRSGRKSARHRRVVARHCRQSATRLLTLDYCVATTTAARKHFRIAMALLAPRKARAAGSNSRRTVARASHQSLSVINHREIREK